MLLSVNETEFEADEAFSHVFAVRPIVLIFHHHIEGISCEEASGQGLYINCDRDKVALLALQERFGIVIRFSANRTETFLDALISLKSFEIFNAITMVDMTATKNSLVLEL